MVFVENNSSNLTNTSSYNSQVYDCKSYGSYTYSLKSDRNLSVVYSWSMDKTNFDHSVTEAYTANASYYKTDEHRARYFKVTVTNNSGADTTVFRSQLLFSNSSTVVKIDELTVANIDIRDLSHAGDSIQSWLYDGSGNAINSTSNKLDVNQNALDSGTDSVACVQSGSWDISATVSATSLDIRNLNSAQDSVFALLKDGTGNSLSSTTGALNVSQNALASGTDSVDAVQSGNWSVRAQDGSGNALSSTGGKLDVNQNALASGTDSVDAVQSGNWAVRAQDGSGNALSSTGGKLDVNQNALASGTDSVDAVQSGNWSMRLQDGSGNAVNSVSGNLNVIDILPVSDDLYYNIDVQNTGHVVNAGDTYLLAMTLNNLSGFIRFVKLYNMATAPAETDTPVAVFCLQPNSTQHVMYPRHQDFGTGLSLRACQGVADSDDTAPSTNDVVVSIQYMNRA